MKFWPQHAVRGKVCARCHPRLDEQAKRYDAIVVESNDIETFPMTYKGHISVRSDSAVRVVSRWWESQDEAEAELKFLAAAEKRDVVLDVALEKSSQATGNYTSSVWRKTGTAFRRSTS
jgi:hypothetical protein